MALLKQIFPRGFTLEEGQMLVRTNILGISICLWAVTLLLPVAIEPDLNKQIGSRVLAAGSCPPLGNGEKHCVPQSCLLAG